MKRHLELPFSFIIWPLKKKISVAHCPSDLTFALLVMHTEQQQYTEWGIKEAHSCCPQRIYGPAERRDKKPEHLKNKTCTHWIMQYGVSNQKSLFFKWGWTFFTQSLFLCSGFFFIYWEIQKVKLLETTAFVMYVHIPFIRPFIIYHRWNLSKS